MTLSIQDISVILGPMITLMGFMWHHSNTKFEKIDEKFEKMDERFEKTDEKIDNLRAEVINVEKRLDGKIDSLKSELKGDINNTEKRLGEKIDAVRDRVSRIEGQLTPTSIVSFKPVRHKETATLPLTFY